MMTNSEYPQRPTADGKGASDNRKHDSTNNSFSNVTDSPSDQERLAPEGGVLDLPEVSDIPGQEAITNAGVPAAMADTTIADDDEGIAGDTDIRDDPDDDLEIVMGGEADVTAEDLMLLGNMDQDMDGNDDEALRTQALDDTDFEGEPLNEALVDATSDGQDLDLPGGELDDANQAIGEEDEENNYWSLGSDRNDEIVEGTP